MVEEKHGRWFHSSITPRWGCCALDTVCVVAYTEECEWRVATAADGPQTKTMMRFNGPRATLPAVDQRPGDRRNTPVPQYEQRCRTVRAEQKSFVIGIIPWQWYIIMLYCILLFVCTLYILYYLFYNSGVGVCFRRKSRRENIVT